MISSTENGLFQPGQSLLHRLDPRTKLLSSLILVILAFSARGWLQLVVLLVVAAVALQLISQNTRLVLRICSMLRWLLLFTLLMHMLWSPGRTLWGLSWLSLDGLYMGAFVCVQIVLAAMVTTILAITTTVDDLTTAFGWFVQPLSWLGCRTDDWQQILLLALGFIPVVREEMDFTARSEAGGSTSRNRRWKEYWSVLATKMEAFTERMLIRGDTMAHEIAAHGASCRMTCALPSIWPLSLPDRYMVTAMMLTILFHRLAG